MKHSICVLLIESKPETATLVQKTLETNSYVSNVEIAVDTEEALLKIIENTPDLVVMEYPPQGRSEKGLIKILQTKLKETVLVFISDTKENAAKAIHYGIFNYLLTPINKEDLDRIIEKTQQNKQTNIQSRISQIIEKSPQEMKIRLHSSKGYIIIDPKDILYCKADGTTSDVYFTNNRIEYTQMFLSKMEELLTPHDFLRVSRSYLINKKYIRKVIKASGIIVLSYNGKEYEVKGSKQSIKNLSNIDDE